MQSVCVVQAWFEIVLNTTFAHHYGCMILDKALGKGAGWSTVVQCESGVCQEALCVVLLPQCMHVLHLVCLCVSGLVWEMIDAHLCHATGSHFALSCPVSMHGGCHELNPCADRPLTFLDTRPFPPCGPAAVCIVATGEPHLLQSLCRHSLQSLSHGSGASFPQRVDTGGACVHHP
jgi:hypothetical protein